jgi:hypothetical protein
VAVAAESMTRVFYQKSIRIRVFPITTSTPGAHGRDSDRMSVAGDIANLRFR